MKLQEKKRSNKYNKEQECSDSQAIIIMPHNCTAWGILAFHFISKIDTHQTHYGKNQ